MEGSQHAIHGLPSKSGSAHKVVYTHTDTHARTHAGQLLWRVRTANPPFDQWSRSMGWIRAVALRPRTFGCSFCCSQSMCSLCGKHPSLCLSLLLHVCLLIQSQCTELGAVFVGLQETRLPNNAAYCTTSFIVSSSAHAFQQWDLCLPATLGKHQGRHDTRVSPLGVPARLDSIAGFPELLVRLCFQNSSWVRLGQITGPLRSSFAPRAHPL